MAKYLNGEWVPDDYVDPSINVQISSATSAINLEIASINTRLDEAEVDIDDLEISVVSLEAHTLNTSNPHSVNKTQVGLGNVPNVNATARANHTGTQAHTTISGLGNAATRDVGTGAAQVAAGDHSHQGLMDYVPVTPITLWSTASRATGSTHFFVTDYTLPSGVRAVVLRMYSKITSGSPSDSIFLVARMFSTFDQPFTVRPQVVNVYNEGQGIVPVNTGTDQITLQVAGATQTCGVQIVGYFLPRQ